MEELKEWCQEQFDLMVERVIGVEKQNLQTRGEVRNLKKSIADRVATSTAPGSDNVTKQRSLDDGSSAEDAVRNLQEQISTVKVEFQALRLKIEETDKAVKEICVRVVKMECDNGADFATLSESYGKVQEKQKLILTELKTVQENTQNMSDKLNANVSALIERLSEMEASQMPQINSNSEMDNHGNDDSTIPVVAPPWFDFKMSTVADSFSQLRRQSSTDAVGNLSLATNQEDSVHDGRLVTVNKTVSKRNSKKSGVTCTILTISPPVCVCGKKFATELSLRTHIRYYTRYCMQKRFLCGKCPKGFSFRCLLRNHMRLSHKIDSRSLPTKQNMGNHEESSSDGPPSEATAIPSSSGMGPSRKRLRRGRKRILGRKTYVCSSCGKHFSSYMSSYKHKRICESENRLKCPSPGCTKNFTTEHNLNRHLAQFYHHREDQLRHTESVDFDSGSNETSRFAINGGEDPLQYRNTLTQQFDDDDDSSDCMVAMDTVKVEYSSNNV